MISEYIKKIVENGKKEDMDELSIILEDTLYKLKEYDPNCFHEYKIDLYEMAYGKILTEEMAEKIISKMLPYHLHWTLEQTKAVQTQYNLSSIRDIDFWIVMNSAYNDFHNLFNEDLENYVKYTELFINDEDSEDNKVYTYFTEIPR